MGSPSRAAAVAGAAAAAAAIAPSSWKPHREPSSQLPIGHDASAVVAKVAVDHSSASSSSGYCSPWNEVFTSSLQPPCMSSPSGCSPQQPGLATCVADADGADAVVGASSERAIEILFRFDLARKKRILSPDELDLINDLKSLLPRLEAEIAEADGADAVVEEEEEPLSPVLHMEAALKEEEEEEEEEEVDEEGVEEELLSPALQKECAIEILFRFDLARKKRILSADELDLIDDLKSLLPCLEAEIGEVNADGADAVEEEIGEVNADFKWALKDVLS
ncbi:unnamed protein product [Miscanthus lutarioriparius]|uniref:Uncharacterized protein n=1 Tax=Miscanthus lutarioriparius TaxID=422564 RepID=A0A811NKQ1_9POAL|nr:unnamed protein product [Miscanthus lutarioriparius]